jgi:hypothetical protein
MTCRSANNSPNSQLLSAAADVAETATQELACSATRGGPDTVLLVELYHRLSRRNDADDDGFDNLIDATEK